MVPWQTSLRSRLLSSTAGPVVGEEMPTRVFPMDFMDHLLLQSHQDDSYLHHLALKQT